MKNLLSRFKNKGGLVGEYVIRSYNHDEVVALIAKQRCISITEAERTQPTREEQALIKRVLKPVYESPVMKNRIVSSSGYGRNIIMRQLSGDTTYAIRIDSAAIGTGSTTPADSQTALVASVLSGISVVDASVTNDNLVLSFFITSTQLTNGTYNEFGLFCNSRLFARSLFSPAYVKSTNQDTTIEYSITLSSS